MSNRLAMSTHEDGIIVEFVSIGGSLKVTAIDSKTLIEASIVGAPKALRKDLSALAIRKLRYVMNKKGS